MTTRQLKSSNRGFTLMEMMVAVALVVLVIIGVSVLTQSMGTMVGTSQASNELLSNTRGVEYRIERDVAGLDRNGFIAIRSRLLGLPWNNTVSYPVGCRVTHVSGGNKNSYVCLVANVGQQPDTSPAFWQVANSRADMIAFISNGTHPNRTGTAAVDGNGNGVGLFNDSTTANAALIWYGHLALEKPNGHPAGNFITIANALAYKSDPDLHPSGSTDGEYVLGRRGFLLMAATGQTANMPAFASTSFVVVPTSTGSVYLPAYASPHYLAPDIVATSAETAASVTSSRVAIASITPAQLMTATITEIANAGGRAQAPRYEADAFCYRIHALADIYGDGSTSYATNYFRTHPHMLQGCTSFAVEWSDGSVDATSGELIWRGLGNPAGTGVERAVGSSGDDYTAIFSYDNKALWPKALRITYTVTDRNNRLKGGRTFSQVLRLPS